MMSISSTIVQYRHLQDVETSAWLVDSPCCGRDSSGPALTVLAVEVFISMLCCNLKFLVLDFSWTVCLYGVR